MRKVARRDDQGAVAVVVAIFMLVAMVLLAFVVDMGRSYVLKGQLQDSVDAAALAGAKALCGKGTTQDALDWASGVAAANGVSNSTAPDSLRIGYPYTVGHIQYLNVRASKPISYVFGGFLNDGSGAVAAQATSGVDCQGEAGFAIYAGNQVNINGGGSNPLSTTGSVFGGGSGGGTCNSNCPVDFPNGVGKIVLIGDAFSPVVPAMKGNSDFTVNPGGTIKHAATLDTTTSTNPVQYATDIGLVDVMNGFLAQTTVVAPVSSGTCSINLGNGLYASAVTITCAGTAVLTGTANPTLKLVKATGDIDIRTDVGSSGNVVILNSGADVHPDHDITVYGSIYAPFGEVRTNGHAFTLHEGRVIALDFRVNGNGGGFYADVAGDPYAVLVSRLYQ